MKKNKGFTLIELLAVIVIIAITSLLLITNVSKRVKESKNILTESQIETIETAALLYSEEYPTELTSFNTLNVDTVTLSMLISKGLILTSDITINGEVLSTSNVVVIAKINNQVKTKYDIDQTGKNIIFLLGLDEVSVYKNETYSDMGAYVAIVGTGIIELTESNMVTTVNTTILGTYTVTYSYTNSLSVTRTVNVI